MIELRVCILGWYGTETIGDRAILAGIVSLLNKYSSNVDFAVGSLYPFYSERMLREDQKIYELLTKRKISIYLFPSKSKIELRNQIDHANVLLIGGGPLMDLNELYMLKYAFHYAQKRHVKKLVYGCGIGPLYQKNFQICVLNLMQLADGVILRDRTSRSLLVSYAKKCKVQLDFRKIYTSFDPAIECAYKYKHILK